ncbi:MAG TPA: cob(I)yrinic acid a,c-diamide adenosyltransferase [Pseudobdellovibrionaceae bacterium]|nr:cob(I)yrinic acid a,c-diamide adenosyltransferase [Pseudobdellovibrionaceae bacterium]
MKIYTKTGDKGTTRLVDGSTVDKFNPRVEAYGTVDELNSWVGEIRHRLRETPALNSMEPVLEDIQSLLFNLGSRLACEKDETLALLPDVTTEHIETLERQMDLWDQDLPELRNFILPAGHGVTTALHLARTVCRRAERRTAAVSRTDSRFGNCLIYLNRLSDFFFLAARWANLKTGHDDVLWKKS